MIRNIRYWLGVRMLWWAIIVLPKGTVKEEVRARIIGYFFKVRAEYEFHRVLRKGAKE